MVRIESNHVKVKGPLNEVVSFLTDMNNFIHLLPKDKISDWKSTEKNCSFKVQGGIKISLIYDSIDAQSKIHILSGEGSPFPFTLDIHMNEAEEGLVEGFIEFNGEMNMFVKMVAEKPLTSLFNYISDQLIKVREQK
jgi:carbon monoxide dehydrogenase subunit G